MFDPWLVESKDAVSMDIEDLTVYVALSPLLPFFLSFSLSFEFPFSASFPTLLYLSCTQSTTTKKMSQEQTPQGFMEK